MYPCAFLILRFCFLIRLCQTTTTRRSRGTESLICSSSRSQDQRTGIGLQKLVGGMRPLWRGVLLPLPCSRCPTSPRELSMTMRTTVRPQGGRRHPRAVNMVTMEPPISALISVIGCNPLTRRPAPSPQRSAAHCRRQHRAERISFRYPFPHQQRKVNVAASAGARGMHYALLHRPPPCIDTAARPRPMMMMTIWGL